MIMGITEVLVVSQLEITIVEMRKEKTDRFLDRNKGKEITIRISMTTIATMRVAMPHPNLDTMAIKEERMIIVLTHREHDQ